MKILVFGFTLDENRLDKNALTFYYDLRKGLETQAENLGLSLKMDFSGKLDAGRAREAEAYDGLIAVNPPRNPGVQKLWNQLEKKKPSVNLGSESLLPQSNYVGTDDVSSTADLVGHLVSEGFRNIGFFSQAHEGYSQKRFEGFRLGLQKHHLSTEPGWVNAYDLKTARLLPSARGRLLRRKSWSEKKLFLEGQKAFEKYLAQARLPEAVIFETDRLAKYAYDVLREQGRRVPEDLAITGFDDSRLEMEPFGYNILTTIRQDFYKLGQSAVRLLLEILKGKRPLHGQRILFPGERVIRKTSLRKSLSGYDPDQNDFKKQTKAFVQRHYAEAKLSRLIADFHLLSPEYFLIKFRKDFGESFGDFLSRIRVERAAFQLVHSTRGVTQILTEAGFQNHQSFNRAFKKKWGLSPLQYRKKQRKTP